jgi:DNA polymerase-3 subunit beta
MQVKVRADIFHHALKSTAFAALRDIDLRHPVFSGILVDVAPEAFRVVATDVHRLAYFESSEGYECSEPATVVLIAKRLAALKLPRTPSVTIKIGISDAEAIIQAGTETFRVPVIQARYPNYFTVFPPTRGAITLHCEKTEFAKALMSARQATTRNNRSVFLWTRPGCVALGAENTTPVRPYKLAAECDYSTSGVFNANYLRDAVQALPAGEIQIRFTPPDAGRPIYNVIELSPASQSRTVIRQLVMPCWRSSIPPLPGVDF